MNNGMYYAPTGDIKFVLNDILNVDTTLAHDAPEAHLDQETLDQVIDSAAKFCQGVLAPLNASGDREGCTRVDGNVFTPAGFKDAYKQYAEDGWSGLCCSPEHGGQGLPSIASAVMGELLGGSNISWALYPRLSEGVYRCLRANASDELKTVYLPKLVSGEWTGTMCLTEPHSGTDLGLLRTKATPMEDGSYLIDGTKIFISSGEHDLTDNIVHLVLARIPSAPTGTRGISLFVVPRNMPDEKGIPAERNGVFCDAIEEKLGLHGNATCVLRFEQARGYLVGELNKGLAAMFVMMNGARLGTGVQALGLTELAHQKSIAYAYDRLQSRAPGARNADTAADPIIMQPDVRRMLLVQQAWAEGARMFLYWIAMQIDIEHHGNDPLKREQAKDFLALLTPIAKAFVSDNAVESANLAVQVHGGSGYIVDTGIEQTLRDVRILPIYEGTNGVQSYDLLARKVIADNGAKLQNFIQMIRNDLAGEADNQAMSEFIQPLNRLLEQIDALLPNISLAADQDTSQISASATYFLRIVGHLVFSYFWCRAAKSALARTENDAFGKRKLATARFYFTHLLPETDMLLRRVLASSFTVTNIHALSVQ